MQILVGKDNLITSYAIIGGFDGGIEINDENIPSGFIENFKPNKYIYRDGKIIINSSYEEDLESFPSIPDSDKENNEETPNEKMFKTMISTLQKQSVQSNINIVKLQKENEELKSRLTEIENKIEPEVEDNVESNE